MSTTGSFSFGGLRGSSAAAEPSSKISNEPKANSESIYSVIFKSECGDLLMATHGSLENRPPLKGDRDHSNYTAYHGIPKDARMLRVVLGDTEASRVTDILLEFHTIESVQANAVTVISSRALHFKRNGHCTDQIYVPSGAHKVGISFCQDRSFTVNVAEALPGLAAKAINENNDDKLVVI